MKVIAEKQKVFNWFVAMAINQLTDGKTGFFDWPGRKLCITRHRTLGIHSLLKHSSRGKTTAKEIFCLENFHGDGSCFSHLLPYPCPNCFAKLCSGFCSCAISKVQKGLRRFSKDWRFDSWFRKCLLREWPVRYFKIFESYRPEKGQKSYFAFLSGHKPQSMAY